MRNSQKKKSITNRNILISLILIIFFLFVEISSISEIRTNANENIVRSSFKSSEVITGTTVGEYSNEDWIVTVGGYQHLVGASTTYNARAVLGDYINIASSIPTMTSTTRNVAAVISNKPFSNISSVDYQIGTGSNGAYMGVSTYLVIGDSLTSEYTLLGELGNITTTLKSYPFDRIEEDKFYAVIFYNPNGAYNLGNVEITFNQSLTYSKVTSSSDLYFGHTYTLVEEEHGKVVSSLEDNYLRSVTVDINNSQIENIDNILSFTLLPGKEVDTFSLKLLNVSTTEEYLVLSEEGISTATIKGVETSLYLTERESSISFQSSLSVSLMYESTSHSFITTNIPHQVVLYKLDTQVDHYEEASIFIDIVNLEGSDKNGQCLTLFEYFDSIYSRLSVDAVVIYETRQDEEAIFARERMVYLSNWYTSTNNRVQINEIESIKKLFPLILIGIISLSSLFIYVQISRKYEE